MNQLEFDLAEYILNEKDYFLSLKVLVNNLVVQSPQLDQFTDEFNEQYNNMLLSLVKAEINSIFNLNSEELNVNVDEQFIEKLLGKNFFKGKSDDTN